MEHTMKMQKRRRREGKTDYIKRTKLLKSNTPRIDYRKTNNYIIAQYIKSDKAQDKIELGATSKELLKYGWPKESKGSLKSIPASYLLGVLFGNRILKNKFETPIIDTGLHRAVHKSRLYAFIKGLVDAGVGIKHEKNTFPDDERIKGKNIKEIPFEKIKLGIENKPFEKVSKPEHANKPLKKIQKNRK